MNRNILPLVLIIVAIGIFFTFTVGQYDKVRAAMAENAQFSKTLEDSKELLKKRDQVINAYNSIAEVDRERLKKLLPDHIDNIRLIIDINGITSRRGVSIKNVRTGGGNSTKTTPATGGAASVSGSPAPSIQQQAPASLSKYDALTMNFNVTTTYENFINILHDLELSLRILDITKISFAPTDSNVYDFSVELKTYWLRQN